MVTRVKTLPFEQAPEAETFETFLASAPAPVESAESAESATPAAAPKPAHRQVEAGEQSFQWALLLAQTLGRAPWAPRIMDQNSREDAAEWERLQPHGVRALRLQNAGARVLVERDLEGQLLTRAPSLEAAVYSMDKWLPISLGASACEIHLAAVLAQAHADFDVNLDFSHWRPLPGSPMPWVALEAMRAEGQPLPRLRPRGWHIGAPVAFTGKRAPLRNPIAAAPAVAATHGLIDPLSLLTVGEVSAQALADADAEEAAFDAGDLE